MSPWRPALAAVARAIVVAPLALLLLGPVLAIFLYTAGMAGAAHAARLWGTLTSPHVVEALRLSALTTSLTVLIALGLGTPVAFWLARRRLAARTVLDSLIDLPLVLPPAVAGLGLLLAFGRLGLFAGLLAAAGLQLSFTTAAVVMAQAFVAVPLYIRSARAGFLSVDRDLELAARVHGATPWQVVRKVSIPLALPSLLGGTVLCWARALGEFGATLIFAGNFLGRTQTAPLAIYAALQADLDAALWLATILLLVAFAVLLAVRRVAGALYPGSER